MAAPAPPNAGQTALNDLVPRYGFNQPLANWPIWPVCGYGLRYVNDDDPFQPGRIGQLLVGLDKDAVGDANFIAMKSRRDQRFGVTIRDNLVQSSFEEHLRMAKDLHSKTNALKMHPPPGQAGQILDLMFAPGGLLYYALRVNKDIKTRGLAYTLPESQGGQRDFLGSSTDGKVIKRFADITTLQGGELEDFPLKIPAPEWKSLSKDQSGNHQYDLVICDGFALPAQANEPGRLGRERHRLLATQMCLAIQYVRQGGTIIITMRRVEDWDCLTVFKSLRKYSTITFYKPTNCHAELSMFYMIAKDIRFNQGDREHELRNWGGLYRGAMVPPEDEAFWFAALGRHNSHQAVVAKKCHKELRVLAEDVWKTQLNAMDIYTH